MIKKKVLNSNILVSMNSSWLFFNLIKLFTSEIYKFRKKLNDYLKPKGRTWKPNV